MQPCACLACLADASVRALPVPARLPPQCSLEVFLPGTPFRLRERMGLRCLMGCVSLLPGAMLLSKRTRAW